MNEEYEGIEVRYRLEGMGEMEAMNRIEKIMCENLIRRGAAVSSVVSSEEAVEGAAGTKRKKDGDSMDWGSYHGLQDIEGFIIWLNATYPELVNIDSSTKTSEGRPIYVVKVTDPSQPGPKKKIWIEGGIHAREWISPAVTTYLLNQVITNPEWIPIRDKTEWYFVPVANPDGYHYSHTSTKARLWRKNRNNNSGSHCKGVDLNRNWNMQWGVGASQDPCSEIFMGRKPFSEAETRGLSLIMERVAPINLFITFHR
ncbi:unnamed protein product, partial [Meganyctiphanes norvegica]